VSSKNIEMKAFELLKLIVSKKIRKLYDRFYFGINAFIPTISYRSYLPDSFIVFNKYPESRELYSQWIQHSTINNKGDLNRYYSLILNLQQILNDGIEGDFAELGVYKGTTASVIAHYAKKSNRTLFLFDTFNGFDKRDLVDIDVNNSDDFSDTSYAAVSDFVGHKDVCNYFVGYFPLSVPEYIYKRTFAFIHLDCDLYRPMIDALRFFWPRLSNGGLLFLHDYSSGYWEGATKAVDEFCRETGSFVLLLPDRSGTAIIRKYVQKTVCCSENENSLFNL